MKALSVLDTIVMFLIGDGIFTHWITSLRHWIEPLAARSGGLTAFVVPILMDAVVGIVASALVLAAVNLGKKFWLAKNLQFIGQPAAPVFLAVESVADARQGCQTPRRVADDREQAFVPLGDVGSRQSALHLPVKRSKPPPQSVGQI